MHGATTSLLFLVMAMFPCLLVHGEHRLSQANC